MINTVPRCPCCNQIIKDSLEYNEIADKIARIDIDMASCKDNQKLVQLWEEFKSLNKLIDWEFSEKRK